MTKSTPTVTVDTIRQLRLDSPQFAEFVSARGRSAVSGPRLELAVYEILCTATEPATINEIFSAFNAGRSSQYKRRSNSLRIALASLCQVGLLHCREQTDSEREFLGMTQGRTPLLYWTSAEIPIRVKKSAFPGVEITPLPDVLSKSKSRARNARRSARVARNTSRPAKASSSQTGTKLSAIERHDIAINEMQGRISSLEAELKRIQQILR